MNLVAHKHLKLPDDKRLFIIGDLHGCWDLYKKGTKILGIDNDDIVISLGDLVDRGPEAFKCVLEFTRKENRYAIMGNHEHMLVKGMLDGDRSYYECWYQNGGHVLWDQFEEEGVTLIATMLENLPVIITVEYRGMMLAFAHGGWCAQVGQYSPYELGSLLTKKNNEKILEAIMWDRDSIGCAMEEYPIGDVKDVDYIFHGHSYVKEPIIHHNRVYMDTGNCFNGNLTFASFDKRDLWFYSTLEED